MPGSGTMTGLAFPYVIFQNENPKYEFGIVWVHGEKRAYFSWIESGEVKTLIDKAWMRTPKNDNLHEKLAFANLEAARWLFLKGLALEKKKETIIRIVESKVIKARLQPTILQSPMVVFLSSSVQATYGPILENYGWQIDLCENIVGYRYLQSA